MFAYLVSSVVPGDLLSDNEHSLVSDHLLQRSNSEEGAAFSIGEEEGAEGREGKGRRS